MTLKEQIEKATELKKLAYKNDGCILIDHLTLCHILTSLNDLKTLQRLFADALVENETREKLKDLRANKVPKPSSIDLNDPLYYPF